MCLVALAVFLKLYLPIALNDYYNSLTAPPPVRVTARHAPPHARQVRHNLWTSRGFAHMAVALTLWINTVYNYACACLVPPGSVAADPDHAGETCRHCHAPRRPHAFHCKECRACMAYMDHHCPFTRNCVGRDNYAYFFLFLLHVSLGLAYSAWLTYPLLRLCWLDFDPARASFICHELGNMSLIVTASAALWLCTASLLAIQCVLLALDWSTLDGLRFLQGRVALAAVADRARQLRFRRPDSRLRVLLLQQRPRVWHWFVPFTEPRPC